MVRTNTSWRLPKRFESMLAMVNTTAKHNTWPSPLRKYSGNAKRRTGRIYHINKFLLGSARAVQKEQKLQNQGSTAYAFHTLDRVHGAWDLSASDL